MREKLIRIVHSKKKYADFKSISTLTLHSNVLNSIPTPHKNTYAHAGQSSETSLISPIKDAILASWPAQFLTDSEEPSALIPQSTYSEMNPLFESPSTEYTRIASRTRSSAAMAADSLLCFITARNFKQANILLLSYIAQNHPIAPSNKFLPALINTMHSRAVAPPIFSVFNRRLFKAWMSVIPVLKHNDEGAKYQRRVLMHVCHHIVRHYKNMQLVSAASIILKQHSSRAVLHVLLPFLTIRNQYCGGIVKLWPSLQSTCNISLQDKIYGYEIIVQAASKRSSSFALHVLTKIIPSIKHEIPLQCPESMAMLDRVFKQVLRSSRYASIWGWADHDQNLLRDRLLFKYKQLLPSSFGKFSAEESRQLPSALIEKHIKEFDNHIVEKNTTLARISARILLRHYRLKFRELLSLYRLLEETLPRRLLPNAIKTLERRVKQNSSQSASLWKAAMVHLRIDEGDYTEALSLSLKDTEDTILPLWNLVPDSLKSVCFKKDASIAASREWKNSSLPRGFSWPNKLMISYVMKSICKVIQTQVSSKHIQRLYFEECTQNLIKIFLLNRTNSYSFSRDLLSHYTLITPLICGILGADGVLKALSVIDKFERVGMTIDGAVWFRVVHWALRTSTGIPSLLLLRDERPHLQHIWDKALSYKCVEYDWDQLQQIIPEHLFPSDWHNLPYSNGTYSSINGRLANNPRWHATSNLQGGQNGEETKFLEETNLKMMAWHSRKAFAQ